MRNTYAESIVEEVTKQLTQLRKAKKISHEKLSQKSGITRCGIAHIEHMRRKPSLLTALKIAHALDMKLWQVLKKIEEK